MAASVNCFFSSSVSTIGSGFFGSAAGGSTFFGSGAGGSPALEGSAAGSFTGLGIVLKLLGCGVVFFHHEGECCWLDIHDQCQDEMSNVLLTRVVVNPR